MSNTYNQYLDDDEEQQQQTNPRMAQVPRKVIRRLEREAAEGKEAAAKLAELERDVAFIRAGVPVDDPAAKYFVRGYDGQNDPAAIKAAWDETFGGRQTNQAQSQTEAELNALAGAQDFVNTGIGSPPPDKLAQRNAELAALSQTDPLYTQKFDAIFAKYGGATGSMVG